MYAEVAKSTTASKQSARGVNVASAKVGLRISNNPKNESQSLFYPGAIPDGSDVVAP